MKNTGNTPNLRVSIVSSVFPNGLTSSVVSNSTFLACFMSQTLLGRHTLLQICTCRFVSIQRFVSRVTLKINGQRNMCLLLNTLAWQLAHVGNFTLQISKSTSRFGLSQFCAQRKLVWASVSYWHVCLGRSASIWLRMECFDLCSYDPKQY